MKPPTLKTISTQTATVRSHFARAMLATMALVGLCCDDCHDTNGDCWRYDIQDSDDAGTAAELGSDASSTSANTDADTDSGIGLPFVPSNIGVEQLPAPLGDVIISGMSCMSHAWINTETCEIWCGRSWSISAACSIVHQLDGTELALISTRRLRIDPSIDVLIKGLRPLVILASDEVEIRGGIFAREDIGTNEGYAGGASCIDGFEISDGNGLGGGSGAYDGNGAGGGGYCGNGGQGGPQLDSGMSPGSGGGSYGNPEITPLRGGSAGGMSGYASGGAGGGAVQIVSAVSITVFETGYINMGGNLGAANSGGGGGSGGAVLLEAPEVTIDGVVAANGGGGGAGDLFSGGTPGKANDVPAPGGVYDDELGKGGNGAAGNSVDGFPGMPGDGIAIRGGGGGGGVGWIRINTADGEADIEGIVSPGIETECASIGKLGTDAGLSNQVTDAGVF